MGVLGGGHAGGVHACDAIDKAGARTKRNDVAVWGEQYINLAIWMAMQTMEVGQGDVSDEMRRQETGAQHGMMIAIVGNHDGS